MKAFKLFKVRKDGSIGPLFINATQRVVIGQWLPAEAHKRNGFAFRPGWHATSKPIAPHLSERGRQWFVVELEDVQKVRRPAAQGGTWYLAGRLRVIRPYRKRKGAK